MKRFFYIFAALILLASCGGNNQSVKEDATKYDVEQCYIMSNENMSVAIGKDGKLYSLCNVHTGHAYPCIKFCSCL